jgi:hypothetical protein
MTAITNQGDDSHWGKIFVKFMSQHFTTNYAEQTAYARAWDSVRNARINAAHPLSEYNEGKVMKCISVLERFENPTPLTKSVLDILKAREKFLTATPCENRHQARPPAQI